MLQGLSTVVDGESLMTIAFQQQGHHLRTVVVVVYHQDTAR